MNTPNSIGPDSPVSLPPVPRRRFWINALLALLIFLSGAIVGGGTSLIVLRNRVTHSIRHPEEGPARIAARLRSKFGLTAEQAEKIETIIRRRQKALMAIRKEFQPRVVKELDGVEEEVGETLAPAQREKWREMFERLRVTWVPPLPPSD